VLGRYEKSQIAQFSSCCVLGRLAVAIRSVG